MTDIQADLLKCEIVEERRITDLGPGTWYYLKLGSKIIPLGEDRDYANFLQFSLERNAKAFSYRPAPPGDEP